MRRTVVAIAGLFVSAAPAGAQFLDPTRTVLTGNGEYVVTDGSDHFTGFYGGSLDANSTSAVAGSTGSGLVDAALAIDVEWQTSAQIAVGAEDRVPAIRFTFEERFTNNSDTRWDVEIDGGFILDAAIDFTQDYTYEYTGSSFFGFADGESGTFNAGDRLNIHLSFGGPPEDNPRHLRRETGTLRLFVPAPASTAAVAAALLSASRRRR